MRVFAKSQSRCLRRIDARRQRHRGRQRERGRAQTESLEQHRSSGFRCVSFFFSASRSFSTTQNDDGDDDVDDDDDDGDEGNALHFVVVIGFVARALSCCFPTRLAPILLENDERRRRFGLLRVGDGVVDGRRHCTTLFCLLDDTHKSGV